MLNIGLVGANGKMGREIARLLENNPAYNLKCAVVADINKVDSAIKSLAQLCTEDITLLNSVDVVVDFSSPKSSLVLLPFCVENNLPIVIGTTGFSVAERAIVSKSATHIPIVFAPNTSLSVNVLYKIVEQVASKLADFEVEIIEAHHRNKKDAPSGTALKIGEVVANARKVDFNTEAVFNRYGECLPRTNSQIGFSVIRGGDIVGNHEVQFIGNGELLSIKSQISNRASFAYGALMAAKFVVSQQPRLYDMYDVLGV